MVICTNKAQNPAIEILKHFNLLDYFDYQCIGGDVLNNNIRKPNKEHLIHAVKLVNGDIKNSIMIGDGHNDVLVAQNSNIPCIALDVGYSRIPLQDLVSDQDIIIKDFKEIPATIEKILKR